MLIYHHLQQTEQMGCWWWGRASSYKAGNAWDEVSSKLHCGDFDGAHIIVLLKERYIQATVHEPLVALYAGSFGLRLVFRSTYSPLWLQV